MYLKQGDVSQDVKNCQYTLHMLTYNVNGIDGSFGPGMVSAVQNYQTKNGLTVTGEIDTATWNSLVKNINSIKVQLRTKGYYDVSVFYGVGDVQLFNALKAFQTANGLVADGMCGPATRNKLFSSGPNNTVVDWDNATLTQGATGDAVMYLQYGLHVLGCAPGTIDGSFGPMVTTAVIWFQQKYGLTADGSVGPATRAKMKTLITEIQQKLYNLNNSSIVITLINGIAGPETYNAVCAFQRLNGLTVDGSVGPATRSLLFGTTTGTTANDDLPLVQGKTGKNVLAFQYGLYICGINPNGFDGSFGPGMYNAVVRFQNANSLTADGSVGNATWTKMKSLILPIQQALKTGGWYVYEPTGIADVETVSAIRGFQSANALTVDGMCGPATKAALGITANTSTSTGTGTVSSNLVQGSNGSLVRYLQQMLNNMGYSLNIDGSFGPVMNTVIRNFQSAHGLTVDGSVGPATWEALFTYYSIPSSYFGNLVNGDRVAKAAEYELYLGFGEDNANDITPYGEWYGMNGQPWCAMFVSWCAHEAGYLGTKIPRYAYCPYGKTWYVQQGKYAARNSNYKPMRGDVVFFWDGSEISHTGIVVGRTDTTVSVIEGNASRKVMLKTYSLTSTYIDGYGIFDPNAVEPEDRPENENLPSPENKEYQPPVKPDNSTLTNISELFSLLEELERVAKEYCSQNVSETYGDSIASSYVLSYLKHYNYNSFLFNTSSGSDMTLFVNHVETEHEDLHDKLKKYVNNMNNDMELLKDDLDGIIDLPHLAVTIAGYTFGLANYIGELRTYTGWAGDVVSAIDTVYMKVEDYKKETGITHSIDYQDFADDNVGSLDCKCNYSDICTDSDAIKIAELYNADQNKSVISAIKNYYTNYFDCRYEYLYKDLWTSSSETLNPSFENIYEQVLRHVCFDGDLVLQAKMLLDNATKQSPDLYVMATAVCKAFSKYLLYHL